MQVIPIAVLAFVLTLTGCSHERDVIYRSTCPDGSAEIQIASYSRFPVEPSSVVELQLSTNQGKKTVKTWKAKSFDMSPCFIAAAWNRDSRKVIVLFRNLYSAGEVVAFDTRTYKPIEVFEMRPLLAAQIRAEYSLSDSVSDPIGWALKSDEARFLFAKTNSR